MKILNVSGFFKPSWESGGVTRVSYELAKQFQQQGNDVTVYATNMSLTDYHLPINKKTEVDGIAVYYFDNLRRIFKTTAVSFPYAAPFIIRKHIREFDVIHIHEYRSFLNLCVAHYARKYHIPYVIQAHGSMPQTFPGQNKLIIFTKKIFDISIGKKLLNGASGFIAVSEVEVQSLIKFGIMGQRIYQIYNGISFDECQDMMDKTERPVTEKRILYVGRLDKRKGIDYLIHAFSRLILIYASVQLVICGAGSRKYVEELRNLVVSLHLEQNVDFRGYVSNKEQEYLHADIVVYPAVAEIFGLVPFEALLCGVPVIVTDDCGCGEIIGNVDCGYLVKYGDVDGLCEMMGYVLNHPDEAANKVIIGREYIERELSWQKVAHEVEKCYDNLL